MARFKSRPVYVEAICWSGDNLDEIFTLTGRIKRDDMPTGQIGIFSPVEPSGYRTANRGDWIVKNTAGHVVPMSPVVFAATYLEEKDELG